MISKFKSYISLIRPKHWLKNTFVIAPIAFAGQLGNVQHLHAAVLAFASFCLAASAIYCFNDIYDFKADKNHPRKKKRPIPSGQVSVTEASVLTALLAGGGLLVASSLDRRFLIILLSYLLVNVYYTISGKHKVITDAFCIASGFVFRVIGGAYAIEVAPTGWLVIITFFLSLFLGFGKRRNEIMMLEKHSSEHRPVLEQYNLALLDQIIVATGTITIISYALYTLDRDIVAKFGTDKLLYTVPFVAYGIFRYIHLLLQSREGDPTEVVTTDKSLILIMLSWLVAFFLLVYLKY